jgi:hypothetical protein
MLLPPLDWVEVSEILFRWGLNWELGRDRSLDLDFGADWRTGSGFWG